MADATKSGTAEVNKTDTESGTVEVNKTEAGKVHMLESMDEYKKYVKDNRDNKLIVVDAFAEWCGPCKIIAPVIATMSKDNTEAAFYKFDVDKTPELAQELGIKAMPTFIFFKDGEEVKKIVGGDKKKIDEAVKELKA